MRIQTDSKTKSTKSTGLNFESDLPHQKAAVADILTVFAGAEIQTASTTEARLKSNPLLYLSDKRFHANVAYLQAQNGLAAKPSGSRIIDIQMETGTGKTYTYTQTMFRLHRDFGVHKFVLIVPTLPIKAGTKAFLTSEAARRHFADAFGCVITLHEVQALGNNKKKAKTSVPQGIVEFVNADGSGKEIHVLLINTGMLNSKSMDETVQESLFFGARGTAFEVLAAVKPVCIIDEPHRFAKENSTWKKIEQIGAQYILRFGATFNQYENQVHRLTGLEAFEQNLVKGVKAFVLDFAAADDLFIQYKGQSASKAEAVFAITARGSNKKQTDTTQKYLGKGDDFGAIHAAMAGVTLAQFNASQAVLSTGLSLSKNDKISPYDFHRSLHDGLLQQAVKEQFKLERQLLTRHHDGKPRIKPLTLIFIDDINGYRGESSQAPESLKNRFEAMVRHEAETLLANENDPLYREWLQTTLNDIAATHGGYFAVDNSDKDEAVEQEVQEILHDKEWLLSPDNPRRFVFSKWTLREGWDNPNVFQICKLRTSGSEVGKLQEVGRGLRLPVNEFMQREKSEQFYLNYFVDFNEKGFVQSLKNEILAQAGIDESIPKELNSEIMDKIHTAYPELTKSQISRHLEEENIIDGNYYFQNENGQNGWQRLQEAYPLAFKNGLNGKIIDSQERPPRVLIRKERYQELKNLWELINRRVVLQYRIASEDDFAQLLKGFFAERIVGKLGESRATLEETRLSAYDGEIFITHGNRHTIDQISGKTMNYKAFSQTLANVLNIKLGTLHAVLAGLNWDYSPHQNMPAVREIHTRFKEWLLAEFMSKQQIGYHEIHASVHPTAFTDATGAPKADIDSANIGRHHTSGHTPANYLFEQVFYDSDLERQNIERDLESVTVFAKIPKNTIRIPVAGGGTYSPDFAYVLHHKDGRQTLNLIVETKDAREAALRDAEKQKIKHAEKLFAKLAQNSGIEVNFKTQFEAEPITDLINTLL